MTQNKFLSTQEVADMLQISKSTIYTLIKRGEIRAYKIGRKIRFNQDDVNAYIARSCSNNSIPLPQKQETYVPFLHLSDTEMPMLTLSGQELVLDVLANYLQQEDMRTERCYLSGFEGLLALYHDKVQAAACQLYDGEDCNVSYVRRLVPGISVVLINLFWRTQGFYVQQDNPKEISSWNDLKRDDLTILNQGPGTNARVLLDVQLQKLGVGAAPPSGYDNIVKSPMAAATAVAAGEADLALGAAQIADQVDGVSFVPLIEERCDLVMRKSVFVSVAGQKLLAVLNAATFHREVERLSDGDYRNLGKIIAEL